MKCNQENKWILPAPKTKFQVKRGQGGELLNCSHFCKTLGESVSAQSQLVAAVATDPIHSIYFTFITNWQNCRCRDYLHRNFPFCPVFRKSMTHHKTDKIISNIHLELISLLPTSYPGHSILTEDIGEIVPRHKIKCNLDAKHFLIHGRLEDSEVRGCSDVR